MNRLLMKCAGFPFSVYGLDEVRALAGQGVYIFCRREINGQRAVLYVGETSELGRRLGPSHEHWRAGRLLNMDEVHVHYLAETRQQRLAIETYLRNTFAPPLNRQPTPLNPLAMIARGEFQPSRSI